MFTLALLLTVILKANGVHVPGTVTFCLVVAMLMELFMAWTMWSLVIEYLNDARRGKRW
jgi:hypothetical protein